MVELRFQISPDIIPPSFLESAYFAGWGRVPRQTESFIEENCLIVQADASGSGTVHVPMYRFPLGVAMESTESLLPRSTPYLLIKELARGALGRLYRRMFDWQMLGFVLSPERSDQLGQIAKRFARLVIGNFSAPGSVFASASEQGFLGILDALAPLVLEINREFTEQSVSWRTRNKDRLPLILGIGANDLRFHSPQEFGRVAELLQNSFHALMPMPAWRELEPQPGEINWERWERHLATPLRFGFQCVLGPLISFSRETMPDWLLPHLTEEGFLESRASRFVNAFAERYGYLVHYWILGNRFMNQSMPEISPERSLALIRMLALQLRSRGVDTPMGVGISQPWGEYALRSVPELEQVQIAETLMGCKDIDMFVLEMDFGRGPHQTLPRDPMTIGNMIDQWSFLGKKLFVSFSVPSAGAPVETSEHLPEMFQWSEEKQRIWTETILLTLVGKRAVRGIFWSQLQDTTIGTQGQQESNYGLLDTQQILKSSFKLFAAAQQTLCR